MDNGPSSSRSPLVIFNPRANRGHMQHLRGLVRGRAELESAEYIETQRSGHAEELARQAAASGRDLIAVGGDGTIHEVVNGLLASGRSVPLGIVAAGSGNDFAWNTLHLPRDPEEALERAFVGTPVAVDGGQVNGHYFANAFSVGFDANIAVVAHHLRHWPLMSGPRLYYGSSISQLLFGYHHCPYLRFRLDEGEWTEMNRYVLLAVSNGPTYGGGFRINPAADPADGWFEVCAIRYLPLFRAFQLLPVVQKGQHKGVKEVEFFRAKKVEIESRLPVHIQMDGETGLWQRYQAEILAGALWVRV